MKNRRALLWLMALLSTLGTAGFPGRTQADVTTPVSSAKPLALTNWTATLSLPQFDPALGTLTSVQITSLANVRSSIRATSTDDTNVQPVTATSSALVTINPPGVSGGLPVTASNSVSMNLPPNGTTNFGGAISASNSGSTTITSPSALASYIGTGTVSVPASAVGKSSGTGSGNVNFTIGTMAGVTVSVVYTYTPPAPVSVCGTVYNENAIVNHSHEATEPGVGSVSLTLTGTSTTGAAVGPMVTTTAPDGTYCFTGLPPGTYTVTETVPSGYLASPPDTGSATVPFSSIDATTPGTTAGNNDFYLFVPVSICGTVFNDYSHNLVLDDGEPGINQVNLTLSGTTNGGMAVSGVTATTDKDGKYCFTGLVPGTYTVTATPPTGYISELNPPALTVTVGPNATGVDFPMISPASTIGDTVWFDVNGNGVRDQNERGIPGVVVHLTDQSGNPVKDSYNNVIQPQTTDICGHYMFTNVLAGNYKVTVDMPAGWTPTYDYDGIATPNVALVNNFDGLTPNNDVDFGYIGAGSLGDFVWADNNGNGLQDDNEPGIKAVTVDLDGPYGLHMTTTTDDNGGYMFNNLPAGNYTVTFTAPAGYVFTTQMVSSGSQPAKDSNPDTATGIAPVVTLGPGGIDRTIDAGLYIPGSLSGFTYNDQNTNQSLDSGEPKLSNVTVTLYDSTGTQIDTEVTDSQGHYQFTGLAPGTYKVSAPGTTAGLAIDTPGTLTNIVVVSGSDTPNNNFGYIPGSISGTVYSDKNTNSILDSGDTGIGGVTVTLVGPDGTQTTTTQPDGTYSFTGLTAGEYKISVPATANGQSLETTSPLSVTLAEGANSTDNNFGYVTGTISGFAYCDKDGNGIYNPAIDSPLAGVTITLSGPGGTKTTTTAADGSYSFTGLVEGSYTITAPGTVGTKVLGTTNPLKVDLPAGGSSPNNNFGYITTGTISGTVYCDGNLNKKLDSGEAGIGGVTVTLTGPGGTKTTTTASDGTYSFSGLVPGTYTITVPTTLGSKTLETTNPLTVVLPAGGASSGNNFGYVTGTISGFTYCDKDGNGSYNPAIDSPLAGVTVTLTGPTGTKTTTTAADGSYSFTSLPPGSYTVTSPGTIGTKVLDTPGTLNVNLPAGGVSPNNNFGYVVPGTISGTVYTDSNKNKSLDSGEPKIGGVTVTLTGPGGTKTTTTAADGTYSFTGLLPGTYTITVPSSVGTQTLETTNPLTVVLPNGGNSTGNNFGYIQPSNCGGGGYTTYTQGGWGACPSGHNPGWVLKTYWSQITGGKVCIGTGKTFTFTCASAVSAFLPQGGSAAALPKSLTNPTGKYTVLAGQVLALKLNVGASNSGVTKKGLSSLTYVGSVSCLKGKTVNQILSIADILLGGGSYSGVSLASVNTACDEINNNFDNGTQDLHYLK